MEGADLSVGRVGWEVTGIHGDFATFQMQSALMRSKARRSRVQFHSQRHSIMQAFHEIKLDSCRTFSPWQRWALNPLYSAHSVESQFLMAWQVLL